MLCKQVRRKIIADALKPRKGNRLVIATGHNSLDLVAYFTEFFNIPYSSLKANELDFKSLKKISLDEEHLEHFSHFLPKLELSSGIMLIKPMLPFSRKQVEEMFAKIQGMSSPNFTSGCGVAGHLERCPYAKERHKRVLFSYLSNFPDDKVKAADTGYCQMLDIMKKKIINYDEALEKVKRTDYQELLF
jgi:hypothetical protein